MHALKKVARRLPGPIKEPMRAVYGWIRSLSTLERERASWLAEEYGKFAREEREYIFLSIARFAHINRPIDGYYFEFGCHGANTMRLAWKHTRFLFNWTYVAFDSFQGLPPIEVVDKQPIWEEGKLATREEDFIGMVTAAGMPRQRLITVRGFYDETLNGELKARLTLGKAAVVYVDCDLYKSAVPVLEFVSDFLQVGTVIVFDDWFCFYGDPERGEQRAWREFLQRHPQLRFVDFIQTNEAKAFICIGTNQ